MCLSRKNGILPHVNYTIIAAFTPGRKYFPQNSITDASAKVKRIIFMDWMKNRNGGAGDYGLPRARCALTMTEIFTWGCSGHGAGDRRGRPYGGLQEVPACGPMWASAHTDCLPIEFRRGRCPHRPVCTSPHICVGRRALTPPFSRKKTRGKPRFPPARTQNYLSAATDLTTLTSRPL